MEDKTKELQTVHKPWISRKKLLRNSIIAFLAITVGCVHYKYVKTLFDNDRNFSYLSELEREMSLRTEMGFYYSYFKTVVNEHQLVVGINKVMNDRLVEFPNEVNAMVRFNILPEVIIGAMYHYFEPSLNNTSYRQCHVVDRGEALAPVESCVGIGEPILFYLEAIWWLAGLTVSALFMQACVLSESVLGGLFAVMNYMANHSECTRVQWAPNERENIVMPMLLLHSCFVTKQLSSKENLGKMYLQIGMFVLNCACLLFWQFSQFIFVTHIGIYFFMEQLNVIDPKTLGILLHTHFCGLHTAILLLQGNDMLKASVYASYFVTVAGYCLFFSSFRIKARSRCELLFEAWMSFLRMSVVFFGALCLRRLINDYLETDDDMHIWEILISKLTSYKSFNTLIYTCSDVFDFLPLTSVVSMTKSFLIPIVGIVISNSFVRWLVKAREQTEIALRSNEPVEIDDESDRDMGDTDDSGIENNVTSEGKERKKKVTKEKAVARNRTEVVAEPVEVVPPDGFLVFMRNLKPDPGIVFNVLQLVVYGVMAGLVMRLKLLFSTQLCVVASLFFSEKNYSVFPKSVLKYVPIFWLVTITPVVLSLISNVSKDISHIGEFSDVQQEQLLKWISSSTGASSAFAGSMPVMAAVMLSARRPIVIHPHYENAAARRRVYSVYRMYGKFSPGYLYEELAALKVTYLIVETKYCYGKSSRGCSFESIWDVETPLISNRASLCHKLLTEKVDNFYKVFSNEHYSVFSVHDYSVNYMPRSFDT